MDVKTREVIGAGILVIVLFALVALLVVMSLGQH